MVKQQAIEKIVSTFVNNEDGFCPKKITIDMDDFFIDTFLYEEGCGGLHVHLKNKLLYIPIAKAIQREQSRLKPYIYFTDYGFRILCCCFDLDYDAGIFVFRVKVDELKERL